MPAVQRRLVDQGTQFTRFYAPISVCCPSRSSFFRAQAAHVSLAFPREHGSRDWVLICWNCVVQNTNITSVAVPYGGWEVFVEKGRWRGTTGLGGGGGCSVVADAGFVCRVQRSLSTLLPPRGRLLDLLHWQAHERQHRRQPRHPLPGRLDRSVSPTPSPRFAPPTHPTRPGG